MTILVIQNSNLAPLGVLEKCLTERNFSREIFEPLPGILLPSAVTPYSGLIVLGGLMNAQDDKQYPHLKKVVGLIQLFAKAQKPILGICLGAQLIARAFGQRVYQHDVMEIGFTPLYPIQSAVARDPLLNSVLRLESKPLYLMQLLTSNRCENQAYRIHKNIYGFQFHFEVNQSIIEDWLESEKDYILTHHPSFPRQLAQQVDCYLDNACLFSHRLGHAWLDLI